MTTTWAEQTHELMRAWSDAQNKLWQSWLDASTKFEKVEAGATGDWVGTWAKTARRTLNAWMPGVDKVPRDVVERLFIGEEAFLRFVDLWLGAVKLVAPKVDTGEDWVELLRRYLEQMKDDLAEGSPARTVEGAALAMGDLPELWSLYVKQMERSWRPWAEAFMEAPWELREAATGDRQAYSRIFTLVMDTWESTYGRYLTSPQVGYTRELSEKVMRGFDAWVDYRRAVVEFQTEVFNTGNHAVERLMRELVERGERGETVTSFKDLFDLWVDTAEKTYFDLFSTEGFAELQGRAMNAAMVYRLREREIMEEFLRAFDIPTRSEVDQIHRQVYDLRIEVRYAKRDLKALRTDLAGLRADLAQLSTDVNGLREELAAKPAPAGPGTEVAAAGGEAETAAGEVTPEEPAEKPKGAAKPKRSGGTRSRKGTSGKDESASRSA